MALKSFLKKHKKKSLAVLLALLSGGGYWGWKTWYAEDKKVDEDTDIAIVEKGDLERTFQELGDLAAKNRVNVASKVSGRIIKLFVKEGDIVSKGQKLAVVQPGKTGAEKFLPSTVVAPIEGVLLRYVKSGNQQPKFVEVGDYVTGLFASQNPTYIMTVADMRKVIVELKINEMDILKLSQDMKVDVTIDALKDEVFPAVVSMVSPQAEKESRGGKIFRVEVELDQATDQLRSGMTARVKAELEKREGVLKLPIAGLFEEKEVELVYLERKGDKPIQVRIETGLRTETHIEVVTGLKEDDRTITEKPLEFEALDPEEFKKKKKDKKKGGKMSAKAKAKAAKRSKKKARRAKRLSR
jgi:membrane fusion protein (multidrug efflux system)